MGKIKKLKRLLKIPRTELQSILSAYSNYYYNSSASKSSNDVEFLCREMRIITHALEKGMSLPIVKKGFGKEKVVALQKYMDKYIELSQFDYDYEALTNAIAILRVYLDKAKEFELETSVIDFEKYKKYYRHDVGDLGIAHNDVDVRANKLNFYDFAHSRHSFRSFDGKPVKSEIVKKALELSKTAPSACNRQSFRVVCVKDREKTQRILDLQGGAKGHSNSDILLIISDLSLYRYVTEFFTPYLDGGIFLMNLLYSFHYYGVDSCPLIWYDYGSKGRELRKIVGLPTNEHVVAIVQIGYAQQNSNYAKSKRRNDSILIDCK